MNEQEWWDEDDFIPIRPIDRWFQRKYGYREWLSWLDAGEPEKFTIIYGGRDEQKKRA